MTMATRRTLASGTGSAGCGRGRITGRFCVGGKHGHQFFHIMAGASGAFYFR